MNKTISEITITSTAFQNNGTIPAKHTGHGEDISPTLKLSELSEKAKSIAIVMDDIKHPLFKIYNHWVIWNIPAMQEIPENIPHGKIVNELGGAVQGIGYGRHKYRGPKPPFGTTHNYQYNVYILDCWLDISENSKKPDLLKAMQNHILQQGFIVGKYK